MSDEGSARVLGAPGAEEPRIEVTRTLEFDAGHRVYRHEGKCASIHGHRYKVEVVASHEALDSVGRVIDFSVLKGKLGTWLDANWDHGMLLYEHDPLALFWFEEGHYAHDEGQKAYLLPDNPTAEILAWYLGTRIAPLLLADTGVVVVEVTVHETPNCRATWRRSA